MYFDSNSLCISNSAPTSHNMSLLLYRLGQATELYTYPVLYRNCILTPLYSVFFVISDTYSTILSSACHGNTFGYRNQSIYITRFVANCPGSFCLLSTNPLPCSSTVSITNKDLYITASIKSRLQSRSPRHSTRQFHTV